LLLLIWLPFVSGAAHFATAGSDGAFNFRDKDSKQRLKVFSKSLFLSLIHILAICLGFTAFPLTVGLS
jgi:hypothetical protein